MKGKTKPQKTKNTFRFQSFSERIASINIDVVHRIGIQSEVPEESDTFLNDSLRKWSDLNFTEDFEKFKNELPEISTLKQLVLNENEVIDLLAKHLQTEGNLALQPLLDLVVAVSKDLRKDFYPHYPKFFNIVIHLVNTQDSEQIEWAFTTLSYLAKSLRQYMTRDIQKVITLYLPYLTRNQPEHIRNFSAESFAFLIRYVKDKESLVDSIFKKLDINNSTGIGQLFFEVVKGVTGQYHSCLVTVFPLLLKKLGLGDGNSTELNWSLVLQCVQHMVESMTEYTNQKFMNEVWNVLETMISNLILECENNKSQTTSEDHLRNVLMIWNTFLGYKSGALITEIKDVIKVLQLLLNSSKFTAQCAEIVLQLVAYLLVNLTVKIEVSDVTALIGLIFKSSYSQSSIFEFVREMFNYGMFEKDILPHLVKYTQQCLNTEENQSEILLLFVQLILHFRPIPQNGKQLSSWKKYHINFKDFAMNSISTILNNFLNSDVEDIFENLVRLTAILTFLPHVKPLDINLVKSKLQLLRTNIFCLTNSGDIPFVYNQVVTCELLMIEANEFFELFDLNVLLQLACSTPNDVFVLRTLDLVLTHAKKHEKEGFCDVTLMDTLFNPLQVNLRSSQREVRKATLRIFASFELELPRIENENVEQTNVFFICLAAEEIDADVQTYRDKLKFLQKLEWQLVQPNIPIGNYKQVPLLYLIGALYVNFKLLWDPICKLIESYARGMKNKEFWEIFHPVLVEEARLIVEKQLTPNEENHLESNENKLEFLYGTLSKPKLDKSDLVKHRQLLWNGMSSFVDIVEPRNKILVPLFIQFIEEEYFSIDDAIARTQDLSKPIVIDDTVNDDEAETTVLMKKKNKFKSLGTSGTLEAYLGVISKFRNLNALHREEEIRELMDMLLSHRNPAIQTLALDYIMARNEPALLHYKERLYNLLKDTAIKSELVAFNIDIQSETLLKEHREKVLPILFRIIYGRMNSSIGSSTSGKRKSTARKSIVMRFLAGAQPSEFKMFLDFAYQPFTKYTNDEALEMVKKIRATIDPKTVLPLKKIKGALDFLGIAFKSVGSLMKEHLPWLLKLVLCKLTIVGELLERRDEVHPRCLNTLKELRSIALQKLAHFFELFDDYPFSKNEIEAIFEAAIWPQLSRLETEGIYSPSPLLKVMGKWSENPRYFPLFAKFNLDNPKVNPLDKLMELLLSNNASYDVVDFILNMLENLFKFADYKPRDEQMEVDDENDQSTAPLIEVENLIELDKSKFPVDEEPPNYGTLLLLPHISSIFCRLKLIMKTYIKNPKRVIPDMILTILLRSSEHLKDPKQCDELLLLLVPFLLNDRKNLETVEVAILKTMSTILKFANNPKGFVKKISILFTILTKRASRAELVAVFKVIAERCPEYELPASIIVKLNSWDRRSVEEPNYMERLEGFQTAIENVPKMTNNTDFAQLIIYNSCYTLWHLSDSSMRYSSTNFLCQLATFFTDSEGEKKEIYTYLLKSTLLPQIRKGLNSKTEAIRHEFIYIFSAVLRSANGIPLLEDLRSIPSDDPDIDFFENIRHIQIHRRIRALAKLAKVIRPKLSAPKEDEIDEDPSVKTFEFKEENLMHFLMPIASSFLFCDEYLKHPGLIDVAVEFVGSVCRAISWEKYENVLKNYIRLLIKGRDTNQKIIVKLVVSVLDAFYFYKREEPSCEAVETILEPNDTTDESVIDKPDNTERKKLPGELSTEKMSRIHNTIIKGLLPQLYKTLTKKTQSDDQHKVNKSSFVEDEEIIRIPVAIAIVKLLQKLPAGTLEQQLPGLFLKLCAFLKSRAESIRMATRDVLVKIMNSIGPRYFPYLLKQMQHTMTKGYQVHVMIFSVHKILHNLSERLTVGDLDVCFNSLLHVCNNELFGNISEEKEVEQIVGKLKEARGCKSYNLYEIIARFISENHLVELLQPLRQVLETTQKHQVVTKATECLQNIVFGLSENKSLQAKTVLIFCYGLINENIPSLNGKKKKTEVKQPPPHLQRPDSYLLPQEPKKVVPKTSVKTNSHILIEFGLQLLQFLIKKGKISPENEEHIQMIDPYIPILIVCLNSVHVKVVAKALRCLLGLIKYPLPSLKSHIHRLSAALFALLNKYASAGSAQGENFEMVVMCFKLISVLVRDIEYYSIKADHLRVLLTYAEEDILDHTRQATAFSLLKAILSRKLLDDMVDEVMQKVAEMSVSSEIDHIRTQCRQVYFQYLIDYPVRKKMKSLIGFYTGQLFFEHEYGRRSALEMLQSIINAFPIDVLKKYYKVIFIPLSTCLVNDESVVCRKMASDTINSLLQRLEPVDKEYLFRVVTKWLQDSKLRHRRLAAQLCGNFVEVEKVNFKTRIEKILPILVNQLDPTKYVQTEENDIVARTSDHLIFHILNTVMKLTDKCHLLDCIDWQSDMCLLWDYVNQHLIHPHDLVRLISSQLIGLLFSFHTEKQLVTSILEPEESPFFLLTATGVRLLNFTYNSFSQLQSMTLNPQLGEQVIKNLCYIAKVTWNLERASRDAPDSVIEEDVRQKLNVDWLIGKMIRECKFEVANNQKDTTKRSLIFKWLAAVAEIMGSEGLNSDRLKLLLTPLYREINDNSPQSDADLKSLAQAVIDRMKTHVENLLFTKCLADLHQFTSRKRAARTAEKALEAVNNPELAAKRKIKKQKTKQEAKKRKIERLRPTKAKKRKLKDFAFVE